MVKNRNFGQKSKFWKKNRNFGQKSKFWQKIEIWPKIEILAKNRSFGKKIEIWSKSKFWSKIEILAKTEIVFGEYCKNSVMTPFFKMYQTFAGFSGRGLQNCIGHFGVILKLRDDKSAGIYYGKLFKKIFKST